jgi:WD40 repeat protein
VATACSDHSARVLDAATGAELCRLDHDGPVNAVAFSPDSTRVATASSDHSAQVLNAATGAELCRLDHNGAVNAVAFSPDGNQVATACSDHRVRVWAVERDQLIRQAGDRLNRNLTRQEWRRYFHDEPYRKTRADLPALDGNWGPESL